ncbi:MAG: phosphoethanolamine transferase domain-containing protein [Prevotella sp.]|nr:phosphoethanolamine transferase domain-containing protein [Prevotella sp.]
MNKTRNNSKPSASHSKRGHEGLTWFMLFLLVLIIPNLVLAVTEQLTAGGRVAGIVMPLAVYGLIMSLSRKTGRTMILMFPVLFLGAFQMVLTYLYGRGPIAVDMWLNLVTTNSGEVGELLSQLPPAIVWVVVIYVPTIALAATLWAKKRWANGAMVKALRLPALCASAGALLFTALLSGLTPYSPTNDMFPLNAVCNLGMAFGRQTASVEYKETSKDFRFYAKCSFEDKEPETLVLVIGETSRADNWQLYGYSRKTNPLLAQVKGLTVFTNYMSQSNTTHKSVPILLSLAEADNYDILYHTKGIMQAFREAGYHTVFSRTSSVTTRSSTSSVSKPTTACSCATAIPTTPMTQTCSCRSHRSSQGRKASARSLCYTPTALISATPTAIPTTCASLRTTSMTGLSASIARSSSTPTTTQYVRRICCSAASLNSWRHMVAAQPWSTPPTTARTSSTTPAICSSTHRPSPRSGSFMCRSWCGPHRRIVSVTPTSPAVSTPTAASRLRATACSTPCSPWVA